MRLPRGGVFLKRGDPAHAHGRALNPRVERADVLKDLEQVRRRPKDRFKSHGLAYIIRKA